MVNLNIRIFWMRIILLAMLFGMNTSATSADALVLLVDASNMSSKIAKKYDKNVLRSRYVRFNNAAIRYLFKTTQPDEKGNLMDVHKIPKIVLNLFPDANLIGEITKLSEEVGVSGVFRNSTGTFSMPITPHIEKMPEEADYYQVDYIHIEEKMRGFPPRRDFQVWRVPGYSDLYEVVETRYLDRATCCQG